jgi:hypothetical protein
MDHASLHVRRSSPVHLPEIHLAKQVTNSPPCAFYLDHQEKSDQENSDQRPAFWKKMCQQFRTSSVLIPAIVYVGTSIAIKRIRDRNNAARARRSVRCFRITSITSLVKSLIANTQSLLYDLLSTHGLTSLTSTASPAMNL